MTEPGKLRDLKPRKLMPPIEASKRIIEQGKSNLPRNKIIRFLKLFFGKGF